MVFCFVCFFVFLIFNSPTLKLTTWFETRVCFQHMEIIFVAAPVYDKHLHLIYCVGFSGFSSFLPVVSISRCSAQIYIHTAILAQIQFCQGLNTWYGGQEDIKGLHNQSIRQSSLQRQIDGLSFSTYAAQHEFSSKSKCFTGMVPRTNPLIR